MSSLSIGKNIIKLLSADKNLKNIVNDRIFPVIADEGTVFPFIVYRRNGIDIMANKDYNTESPIIMIQIAATNYSQSVLIAEYVRKALEHKNDETIDDIIVQDGVEDWLDDTFIQNITFLIKLK